MEEFKASRADAKLQTLAEQDEQFAEDMWRFRNPEKGGKKLTYAAILVEVPLRCGFVVSLSALYRFYRWLALKRRWDTATETAEQVVEQLAKDPEVSGDQLDKVAEKVFKTEFLTKGNAAGYVAVGNYLVTKETLKLKEKIHELNRDRFTAASKSKVEAGLDAMWLEIQDNPRALAHYEQMKKELAKG